MNFFSGGWVLISKGLYMGEPVDWDALYGQDVKKLMIHAYPTALSAAKLPRSLEDLSVIQGYSAPGEDPKLFHDLAYLPRGLKKLHLNRVKSDLSLLPASLEHLSIIDSDVQELPRMPDGLKKISISECKNLTSIFSLVVSPSLTDIDITFCKKLEEYPDELSKIVGADQCLLEAKRQTGPPGSFHVRPLGPFVSRERLSELLEASRLGKKLSLDELHEIDDFSRQSQVGPWKMEHPRAY